MEINSGKLSFRKGERTKLTTETPIIAISATYGDPTSIPEGTLISASPDSSLYIISLSDNGTQLSNYTLTANQIKVYLYNSTALTRGGIIVSGQGNLETYVLIGLIAVIIGMAAVMTGTERKKKGGRRN